MNVLRKLFGASEDASETFSRRLRDAIAVWKKGSRGRFELSGHDSLVILVTTFTAGIRIRGLTDLCDPMIEIVRKYFVNTQEWMERHPRLSGNPERAVSAIYRDVQCTLMAYRARDFVAIQSEPQFCRRNHGKANLVKMLASYLSRGEDGLKIAFDEVTNNRGERDDAPIRYSGGNGSSMVDAIAIHTTDSDWGVEAEYWYLNHTYGRIKKRSQSLRDGASGRRYDCISFATPDGSDISVYFDISEFLGKGPVKSREYDRPGAFRCPLPSCTITTPHDH